MITYKDIKIAVNRQLASTGIEINSRDVAEGFNRPSFFVQLDNTNRGSTVDQTERSLTVRIYYFPTDRYEYAVEVLEMQETLEDLFDMKLPVEDRLLNIDELMLYVSDGVLNCSFDIAFEQARDKTKFQPERDTMQELYYEE